MIEGRQWYITRKSFLFVQFRKQDIEQVESYECGTKVVGVFPDGRTMFEGIVIFRTKTGLSMANWRIYQSTDGVPKA